jgi:PST family polysaccharide transporter
VRRDEIDGLGEPLDPGLGLRMRSGLRWSLVSTVLGRLVNPLTGIVLARILTPEDFGIFAVALIALNGLTSINELGVTYAVVRWPGNLASAARTATTIAIAGSVLVFGACFVAAPLFASELNTPEATGVLRLLALAVVIDGVAAVPIGLLTRAFRQDKRALAEWSGFLVSTGLTIGLAVAGFGAWSLAWGRLGGNATNALVLYALAPSRPRPGWDRPVARDLLRFGIPLTGSSFLVFAMLNVDYVVVGRELGTVQLGFYMLAFNLSSFAWNLLSTAVRPVAVPGFARFQHDRAQLTAVFLRWFHLLMVPTVPICALLGTLALPLITVVYGEQWEDAAPVLVFLAALGGLRVAIDFCYDLFVAVGDSRILVRIQALWVVVLVPALTIGARVDGLRGVGIGHAAVAALVIAPTYLAALQRRRGIPFRAVLARLRRPAAGGLAAVATGIAIAVLVEPAWLCLTLGAAGMLAVYTVVGVAPRELREYARRLLGRTAPRTT